MQPEEFDSNELWQWAHPQIQGNLLLWLVHPAPNTYYCGGWNGTFMKTTDNGETWEYSRRVGDFSDGRYNQTRDAWFFDENTGLITGYRSVILRTTDGGVSFNPVNEPAGLDYYEGIHFINQTTGFVAAFSSNVSSYLIKTTDSGLNWFLLPGPTKQIQDVYTSDGINIFTTGTEGAVYKSTNGGTNWDSVNTGIGGNYVYSINFLNSNTGFATGSMGASKSTDGGNTWALISAIPSSQIYTDVDFKNGNIYITGDPKYLYKSTDNGNSWDTLGFLQSPTQFTGTQWETEISGNDSFITVGQYGIINQRMTETNRLSRTKLVKGGSSSLSGNNGVMYNMEVESNGEKIWAVGAPSVNSQTDQIMHSSDGGLNWIIQHTDVQNITFYDIEMLNSSVGYIVGMSGKVLKTSNGGVNWNSISFPSTLNLFGCYFLNSSTGWVVGSSQTCYKTTDGGESWISQTVPVNNIYSISFADESNGWIGGDLSLAATTDGGNTWNTQITNFQRITDIFAQNTQKCYASGVYNNGTGFLKYTSDGGINWESQYLQGAYSITSVSFSTANPLIGYAAGDHCYKTTNGGNTWIRELFPYGYAGTSFQQGLNRVEVPDNGEVAYILTQVAGVLIRTGGNPIGIDPIQITPGQFRLFQNFPNPFNPVTKIRFELPKAGIISLKIYDITGKEVKSLINNEHFNSGIGECIFNAEEFSSGVYFYSLIYENHIYDTKKMVLVK